MWVFYKMRLSIEMPAHYANAAAAVPNGRHAENRVPEGAASTQRVMRFALPAALRLRDSLVMVQNVAFGGGREGQTAAA